MIFRMSRLALHRDERGITAVEFAMVAPVMLLMMMGFFEMAHREYVRVILQSAVAKAARESSLEGAGALATTIDGKVQNAVRPVAGTAATFAAARLSYSDFSQVAQAERYIEGTPDNDRYDLGECFDDVNGNGQWDADLGLAGQGGARDAVLYRMTVNYPRMFPVAGMFGLSPTLSVSATSVMRNQPFGDQQRPTLTPCP
jgi:Flp pilus assembly protein TadG